MTFQAIYTLFFLFKGLALSIINGLLVDMNLKCYRFILENFYKINSCGKFVERQIIRLRNYIIFWLIIISMTTVTTVLLFLYENPKGEVGFFYGNMRAQLGNTFVIIWKLLTIVCAYSLPSGVGIFTCTFYAQIFQLKLLKRFVEIKLATKMNLQECMVNQAYEERVANLLRFCLQYYIRIKR